MINHINYLPGLGLSDHVCIFFELNVYIAKPEQSEPKFCYHKGDYTSINNYLMGINWVTPLQGKTIEDIWKYISTEINQQWMHIYQSPVTQMTKNVKYG